jgi:hypothetical protein
MSGGLKNQKFGTTKSPRDLPLTTNDNDNSAFSFHFHSATLFARTQYSRKVRLSPWCWCAKTNGTLPPVLIIPHNLSLTLVDLKGVVLFLDFILRNIIKTGGELFSTYILPLPSSYAL